MGLENGVVLYTKDPVDVALPLDFGERSTPTFDGNEYCYSICFWRKCWNIRRDIITALGGDYDDGNRDFLDVGDVKAIWHVINHLNKKKRWNEGDSIWTYKEIRDHLDGDLTALEWLIYVMRQLNPDNYHVEFYDSY